MCFSWEFKSVHVSCKKTNKGLEIAMNTVPLAAELFPFATKMSGEVATLQFENCTNFILLK